MMDVVLRFAVLGWMLLWGLPSAFAHCEIPCGIYDDELRVRKLAEDITTIEKSMTKIRELSKNPKANINQLVRWVDNKELHADDIRHIATQYFLAQRIKPVHPKGSEGEDASAHAGYLRQLSLLHGIVIAAMKSKQTTDLTHVARLRELLNEFRVSYFGPEEEAHLAEEHHHHGS